MRRLLVRALLAGAVGLGVVAGLAPAQEPYRPMPAGPSGPIMIHPPAPVAETAPWPEAQNLPAPRRFPRLAHASHWVLRQAAYAPCNCWSHHDSLGCSSLQSTAVFIFGSCRTFFGEPCFKTPPPPPMPVGPFYRPGDHIGP